MLYLSLISLIFIFGLCIGSFLNVLIYRLPNELSILGRSFCPLCKKKITWNDNIPLFSYLFLRGKCRHCRKSISIQYPLVEILTGILFVLSSFILLSSTLTPLNLMQMAFTFFLISVFISILFIDFKHQIIPDLLVYPSVVVVLLYQFINQQLAINNFSSAFGFSFFFLLLHLITKGRGMGLGDVKFAFLIGLVLGFEKSLLAFYLAFLTGAVCGIILILAGRKKFGQHIPFGPFLVGGAMFAYLAGDQVIKWISAAFF